MHAPATPLSATARLARLSRIGLWVSTAALLLAIGFLLWSMIQAALGLPDYALMLLGELEIAHVVTTLTLPQIWIGTLFWLAVDVLGVMMLWQVRRLFAQFRAAFSAPLGQQGLDYGATARHLRRIGVIILAMGPVSMLSQTLGGMALSAWGTGNALHVIIGLEDSDVYAIVIGLVITAASHMMLEAARLSDENRAFV